MRCGETEENDCLDELSRQRQDTFALSKKMMGLGFHLSLQTLALTNGPLAPCCFYALVAQIMSR